MTEILTESFCERCGTRYTFETAAPRKSRVGRVRTVSRGLRNYVLQDESSFSEAMADARSEDEHTATAHQLDAFHKTFNFCMTCRQYTCGNCWNTGEGRCLTCSPLPGSELQTLPAAAAIALPLAEVEPLDAVGANGHTHDEWPDAAPPESWPEADLTPDRLARALGVAAAGDEVAETDQLEASPSLQGVAPGQSLEDALAAYEAQIAAEEDAELETLEAEAASEAEALAADFDEDRPLATIAAADAVADDDLLEAPAEAIDVSTAEAAEEVEPVAAATVAVPEADADAEPGAVGAIGAAAIAAEVLSDDAATAEPERVAAEHEPERDHDLGKVAAVSAAAGALWPVDDDEPRRAVAQPDESEAVPAEAEAVAEEAEPVAAEAGPELVAAEAEPELVAAEAEPEPVPQAEPDLHPLAAAAVVADIDEASRDDVVVQPTWPVDGAATPVAAVPDAPAVPEPATPVPASEPAAPVVPPEPVPAPVTAPQAPATPAASPWLTVAPDDGIQPEWPAAPQWNRTAGRTDIPATLAGRSLLPRDDAAALWAASAREVLTGGAVNAPANVPAPVATPQPCVSCGLSLSANARFCRRCGTRQA